MQLGDNMTITRSTPVAVVGLGSGVAMLALGDVRSGLRLPRGCCVWDACGGSPWGSHWLCCCDWEILVFARACLWFVRRGSGDCDVLIAAAFLCRVERRRGLVLGKQRLWPSDACYCG